ncbi:hypothetical protein DDE82_003755 [Stemphylium lycopersici]|nr:hypothetical protein DDE82_003755 [Stemphylium lycopersici]
MGSDWHPRRHPQPDPNHFAARTLPSFAELTSSSTDSVLHRPRDSVPPPPPPPPPSHLSTAPTDRPGSRSTPPTAHAATEFANHPPAVERTAFTPINHASPHVSPPLSSGPSQSLHDTAQSQHPVSNIRQDSAIAQHRFDHSKDTEPSSLPSSVFAFSYFHPAVGNGRQSNTSRPISHPVGPSSPHSPPTDTRSVQSQPPLETGSRSLKSAHSPAQSLGTHFSAEPARSPEQARGPLPVANSDSGYRNPLPSPTLEQTNGTGRHQRYNVRFNTVYTSENMPPNQRPRSDPPPTAPSTVEAGEDQTLASEQTITPSVEPVTPSAMASAQSPEEQPQPQPQNAPQLERCRGCQEPWRRPLPGEDQYRLSSPAQNMGEQLQLTQDFIKRLENHAKFADEAYATWQRKHRWYTVAQGTSPPATDAPPETRSKSEEERSPTNAPAYPVSAKRKSEIPHEASKYRRVAFEQQPNATPPVRPTAPA